MSSNNFSSSSYSYSSSSSSTTNGQTTGFSSHQQIQSNPSGTTVTSSSQNLGEAARHETRQYDAQGRELIDGPAGAQSNRISDAEQAQRDAEYEERIEEEYAKREGGA
ncbi:hypothetical protein AMS68_007408 [Peltaster fructicola]|uniref:Uncharacterized protein n=1 Tax=Peltaster fructicola TaxID=286661 RepID=A0A6H0Y4P6_9PEZI|nr:hypothetical protein AMS68_007408 [Peltaster fructicola]